MLNAQSTTFTGYFETLEILSRNSTGNADLIESQLPAVNFDKYTEDKYAGQLRPASNDALYFTTDYNYFIEFKDSRVRRRGTSQLHKKNRDSVTTLVVKAGEDVNDIKSNYIYVLVYKPKLVPEQGITMQLAKFVGKKVSPFNLDKFKGTTFLDVHTLSVEEFNNNFIAQHLEPTPQN